MQSTGLKLTDTPIWERRGNLGGDTLRWTGIETSKVLGLLMNNNTCT